MKNKKSIGYFQLSMGMILAGSSVVVGKMLNSYPIFFVVDISLFVAFMSIWSIARMVEGKIKISDVEKSDWKYILFQSLAGIVFFRLFMMLGVKYTSAVKSGIVLSTTPAVLAVLAWIFLKEKMTKIMVLGVAVCVSGILLINISKGSVGATEGKEVLGMFFMFLSVVSEAMFTIFRKKQSVNEKPLTSTFYVMFIAFVLLLPLGIYEYINMDKHLLSINLALPLLYYGVFASSLAYVCWFSGLAKVAANKAAGFTGLMPVASVVLACVVLGESIKPIYIVGMVLIFAGIRLITGRQKDSRSI
ncbi:MAG: DMT family transporter [Eubacteriales bacterium]